MSSNSVEFNISVSTTNAINALNKFDKTVNKVTKKVLKNLDLIENKFDSIEVGAKQLNNVKLGKFRSQIKKTDKGLGSLEKRIRNINKMSLSPKGGVSGGRGGFGGGFGGSSRLMSGALGLMGGFGAFGLMNMLYNVPDAGIKFESSMTDIKGILENKGGIGDLASTIREIGRESSFTINEMAGAAKFMSMAGMDSKQISGSLGAVSNLGMVGNMGVERSADIITNIMSSMGLDLSKDTGTVSDIITSTMTNANVSIEEIGQSMSYVGNVAAQTGTSINETAAAIGILGNNGIKASRAGTGLRQMFLKLSAPTKKGAETIAALGLDLYDIGENGKTRLKPLADILKQLKDSGAGVKQFKDIFGVYGQQAVGALVSGLDKYNENLEKMQGDGGLTDKLAENKRNTTAGKLFVLKSKWEDLSITLMDKIRPAFNYIVDGLTKLIDKLANSPKFLKFVEDAANGIAVALEGAYHVGKWLFNLILDNWQVIVTALTAIGTTMATIGIVSAVANPFTPWIVSLGILVAGVDKLMQKLPSKHGATTEEQLANQYRGRLMKENFSQLGQAGNLLMDGEGSFFLGKLGQIYDDSMAGAATPWFQKSDKEVFDYMLREGKITPEEHQANLNALKHRKKLGAGSMADDWKDGIGKWLKDFVAPKGSELEKTLTKLKELESNILPNLGTTKTSEGDAAGTLATASPLTSTANELSRSIVVNIHDGLLHVENQNIGVTDGQMEMSSIEAQMAEVLTSVIADFELGITH